MTCKDFSFQFAFSVRYLASWALLIQFLMCLVLPIFTGKKSAFVATVMALIP